MILGRGTIASIIPDREGFLFFACGESNRFPLTLDRKLDERLRIIDCSIKNPGMFVYFSGLNIYYQGDKREDYTIHKIEMESLVKEHFENYCIFRLGSVTWGDNPNTLVNSIKKQLNEGNCNPRPVYRYLHTKEELIHWINLIPEKGKHEMNVTGKMVWVPDLVEMIKNGEI